MNRPRYIIIAGVNGAGKSSLYDLQPELFANTKRINADEILQKMGGDWRKPSDNIKAMRSEFKQVYEALETKTSIHVETTLAGSGKAQLRLINKAHNNGFYVTLLYVALDSSEKAIHRVKDRVEKGGHGIPQKLIKKRYEQSNANLSIIAFESDSVDIYDNSRKFVNIYSREGKNIKNDELNKYPWINSELSNLNNIKSTSQFLHDDM
ncbi:zeta toxin family protein [Companilactobacillus allii]|uniref:UDP-N-acetylglucosamine kinase n=1 Tax=Companilactobacillus allii TaxID=1847728 RepID=A0A1P8Q244_9LACO|nr:zeta toxin family protein [Companilactobacillus allii]APX71901.1 ATPase [Companilactobacillus allii]USQ68995.1 zeta toxin family protein [Companilactobacillus allii]